MNGRKRGKLNGSNNLLGNTLITDTSIHDNKRDQHKLLLYAVDYTNQMNYIQLNGSYLLICGHPAFVVWPSFNCFLFLCPDRSQ